MRQMMIIPSSTRSLTVIFLILVPLLLPSECHQSQGVHATSTSTTTTTTTTTSTMTDVDTATIISAGSRRSRNSRKGTNRIHAININSKTTTNSINLNNIDRRRRQQRQRRLQPNIHDLFSARRDHIGTVTDTGTDTDTDILRNTATIADTVDVIFPTWKRSKRYNQYVFTVRGGGEDGSAKGGNDKGFNDGGKEGEGLIVEESGEKKQQTQQQSDNDANLEKPLVSIVSNNENDNNNDDTNMKSSTDTSVMVKSKAEVATTKTTTSTKTTTIDETNEPKPKITAFKKQLSIQVPKIAKDFNKRIHKASTTFKQRTVHHTRMKLNEFQQLQLMTKQSLKTYMESMKEKKHKLLLGLGKHSSSTGDGDDEDGHIIIAHVKNTLDIAKDKWKEGSIIVSKIVLGTGMNLRQDVMIWSVAFVISLMGTSLGFHSFLYFVTVGLSVSVGLNALTSLILFNTISSKQISFLSNLHTSLVVLWSVRLTVFLLHREFINWREWHSKLKETDERFSSSTKNSKIPIWLTCSTCYSCMIMPCIYRLKASIISGKAVHHQSQQHNWGIVGKIGITFQSIGLLLETVADIQKAKFKRKDGHRHLWCNVGLWSFSTYPNYLGEVMFWVGTYLGGISCCNTIMQHCLCLVGLIFILMVMKGAIDSLSSQHMRKWGRDDEWLEFRRTHSILGPIRVSSVNKEALPIYR